MVRQLAKISLASDRADADPPGDRRGVRPRMLRLRHPIRPLVTETLVAALTHRESVVNRAHGGARSGRGPTRPRNGRSRPSSTL